MGVELELLHWAPLFLTLLSFQSLMQPTSGPSKSNPGETLFDMSSLPRVSGKTGPSEAVCFVFWQRSYKTGLWDPPKVEDPTDYQVLRVQPDCLIKRLD